MASDRKFIVKGDKTSDASQVRHTIHAHNLAGIQNWIFCQDYETQSKTFKTRWRYKMTFNSIPDSGNVSCSFILERKDSGNWPMTVVFRVSFSHENYRLPLNVETFEKDSMLSGDELQGIVAEIIPYPKLIHMLEKVIIIDIFISVRIRHPEINAETSTSKSGNNTKALFSRF